jgi:enoyl-CoA hydratase/carnithine racemase
MIIEFFLERARIELMHDGFTYRGSVLDLPSIQVTGSSPEQCRARLVAALSALLAEEANQGSSNQNHSIDPIADTPLADALQTLEDEAKVEQQSSSPAEKAEAIFTDISYEKKEWVARVTINRPADYNSYTEHTLREMARAFRDAAQDETIAVLVLTGAGDRAFSVGGDILQLSGSTSDPNAIREWLDALIEAHTSLRQLGKPSIARINGIVAGGGNEWNLACDLAIAVDHARFVQVETQVGLAAIAGAHWLPMFIGERRARELFLTGEAISANKALLWGMINDVSPPRQLDNLVNAMCQRLINRFPESTSFAREQLSYWKDLAWDSILKSAREKLETRFADEEARAGLLALSRGSDIDYRAYRNDLQATERRNQNASQQRVESESAATNKKRSCYSCGAQAGSEFLYCGLCGTKLI